MNKDELTENELIFLDDTMCRPLWVLTIKELDALEKQIDVINDRIDDNWDYSKPFGYYDSIKKPLSKVFGFISRCRRLRKMPKMEAHDNIGNLMTLEDFKGNVDGGGFIDYDGYGYYSNESEQSNITIYPSDIKNDMYRKDFTHVKWYNR